MRALAAVLVLVALAACASGASPDRAEGQVHAQSAKKPRCLWPKRECHPPANLWYRITVEFRGQLTRHSPNSIPAWVRTTTLESKIVSSNAVRLRLMCDDRNDDAGPYLVKRRINGKLRTIGGCGPGTAARRSLHSTLRFAAKGNGELTRWENTEVGQPVDDPTRRCDGYSVTATAPRQALSGAIRTNGGSVGGIEVSITSAVRVVPPSGRTTYTCTVKRTGETTTRTATGLSGACCHIFGSTGWFQRDALGWRAITERLRFSPKAANFGRRYTALLRADQGEITEPNVVPAPPPGAGWLREKQEYSYVIRLQPCPNQGLDVGRC